MQDKEIELTCDALNVVNYFFFFFCIIGALNYNSILFH